MQTTFVDQNTRTFAVDPGSLDGKQDYLVELGASDDSVKLLSATVGNAIGTVRNLLQPGNPQVSVRLLGKDGTLRVVQGAAIAKGALVKGVTGGTVTTASTTGDRVIGRKISAGPGFAGEVIEIIDYIDKI